MLDTHTTSYTNHSARDQVKSRNLSLARTRTVSALGEELEVRDLPSQTSNPVYPSPFNFPSTLRIPGQVVRGQQDSCLRHVQQHKAEISRMATTSRISACHIFARELPASQYFFKPCASNELPLEPLLAYRVHSK